MAHTAAYDRFVASMKIGYMEVHEGTPYDLDALASVSAEELAELETLLIERKNEDWRDVDALARINSPAAVSSLHECLKGPNRVVRIRAAEWLHGLGQISNFDDIIVEALRFAEYGEGLKEAEVLAAAHPTKAVKNALIQGALCATDNRGVSFVALLFFIYGKASVTFDWDQRPFFLRFATKDQRERRKAFDAMCQMLGIDGSKVSCP